jgi:hypothetical protein
MSERGLTMKRHINQLILRTLLVAVVLLMASSASAFAWVRVGVGVNVGFAPPPVPVVREVVTPCPGVGYAWVGGHWGWYPGWHRYGWVRGSWAARPFRGAAWVGPHYGGRAFFPGHWR